MAKKEKKVREVLQDIAKERQASGCTLSDKDFEIIVKVVQACVG